MADPVVVASPCTGVCRIDAGSGWCEGCLRTIDEIVAWSTLGQCARQSIRDELGQRRAEVDRAGRSPEQCCNVPEGGIDSNGDRR